MYFEVTTAISGVPLPLQKRGNLPAKPYEQAFTCVYVRSMDVKFLFIMKKTLLLLACFIGGVILWAQSQQNETFVQDEKEEVRGNDVHCRCHSDGNCYGGNQISFRPLCAYGVMESGTAIDCTLYNASCGD